MTQTASPIVHAQVQLNADDLLVTVRDARPEVFERFSELSDAQRLEMARTGWSIGVRALMQAHAQAQEAKLGDIGRTLLEDLDRQLNAQLERQQKALTNGLARFFDPSDGQVSQRLDEFVKDEGSLARLLQRYVGSDHSMLAKTLAQAVGEQSALFKYLSPTESEGLVQILEARVQHALRESHQAMSKAMDPLDKDGAVGRFLLSLREELETADEDRQKQLTKALAALDQNDDGSLLSRLLRETRAAHDHMRRAVDPRLPDSPLAQVQRTLAEMLEQRLGRQEERLAELQKTQREFQRDVRDAVQRIETRRSERAASAPGGADFEDAVVEFVTAAVPAGPCVVEATGSQVGLKPHCRKGDVLVRFSEETAFAGSAMVIEAKRDASYNASRALEELEEAMANRGAITGIFVMAKTHAPPAFPPFARYGTKLLITWDPSDPVSGGMLHGAIVAGLALAQRKQSQVDPGDLKALQDVEQRLIREVERLAKMEKSAGRIRGEADTISEEVRKGSKELTRVVEKAKATLRALNIEVREEAEEAASPIVLNAHVPAAVPDVASDLASDAAGCAPSA
jgi:hypothetical protein